MLALGKLRDDAVDFLDESEMYGDIPDNESDRDLELESPRPINLAPLVENDEAEEESNLPQAQGINNKVHTFNFLGDQEQSKENEVPGRPNHSPIRKETKRQTTSLRDFKHPTMATIKMDPAPRNDQFYESSQRNTMRSNSFIMTHKQIQEYAIKENTEKNNTEKYSPPFNVYFDVMKNFQIYFPHNNPDRVIRRIIKQKLAKKTDLMQKRKSRVDLMKATVN